MRPGTIWKQRKLLNDLIGWLQGQELAVGDLSMAQADRFMADRRAAGVRRLKTRKALGPILDHLRGLGLVPVAEASVPGGPVAEVLNRYQQFLIAERGLVPVMAFRYCDCLRPFLDRRLSADGLDLGSLTAGDVTSFVVKFLPESEWRGSEADDDGAAVVPWLSACAGRDGTRARLGCANRPAPPVGGVTQGA